MNIEEYIATRVDKQINWYDEKSIKCQKRYKKIQYAEIIIASLIPLLSGYARNKYCAIIIGAFGSVIAILESITKLNQYHENWIQYRGTCELLKYEKYLYITKTAPYTDAEETIENIFVQNIERIISSENNLWKSNSLHSKNKNSNQ